MQLFSLIAGSSQELEEEYFPNEWNHKFVSFKYKSYWFRSFIKLSDQYYSNDTLS